MKGALVEKFLIDQEKIALGIVFIAFLVVFVRIYRKHLARGLSEWFLKRGKVKLAMRFRSHSEGVRRINKLHKSKPKSECGC